MINDKIEKLFDSVELSKDLSNYFELYNNYYGVDRLISNISLFILFGNDTEENLEQFKNYIRNIYNLNVESITTYKELIILLQNYKNNFLNDAMNIVKKNYNNKIQKEIEKNFLCKINNNFYI